jgi:hypothetical protein
MYCFLFDLEASNVVQFYNVKLALPGNLLIMVCSCFRTTSCVFLISSVIVIHSFFFLRVIVIHSDEGLISIYAMTASGECTGRRLVACSLSAGFVDLGGRIQNMGERRVTEEFFYIFLITILEKYMVHQKFCENIHLPSWPTGSGT